MAESVAGNAFRTVVALYANACKSSRVSGDFKTHLGLRWLRLKVNIAERTGRLLLGHLPWQTAWHCYWSFTGSGKSSARFGDSPSTPAPRKLSDVECALRGAGHAVAPALERTGQVQLQFLVGWVAAGRSCCDGLRPWLCIVTAPLPEITLISTAANAAGKSFIL